MAYSDQKFSEQGFPYLQKFASSFAFKLDSFQIEACKVIEAGGGVLVAAPTGAGKTICGEFAIFLAAERQTKAFYTTPIKALSNQKYLELCAKYGKAQVGLLTGDTNINSDAPLVVMTTEVLRNMIYAASSSLDSLQFVVMDEVHYLADRNRGAVWEEVILHLPQDVQMISLSATVSNAEEFGQWLDTVRGNAQVIVSEHRPVPLWQHVMAQDKIYDLYQDISFDTLAAEKNKKSIKVNPDLLRLYRRSQKNGRMSHRARGRRRHSERISRASVLKELAANDLLPAIYFIFSRNGCDGAVEQIIISDIDFLNRRQKDVVLSAVDDAVKDIPQHDLAALGFKQFKEGLARGVATHHAGMLPVFKELVEKLFSLGMLKVVFATETLALGVNMPARSVVLEKLVKFNGTGHVDITAGEYTQLTGRAGRRGIDVEGHAVVLWNPDTDPQALAKLASKRSYPLRSSFRPSYNMAVNLIEHRGKEEAQEILETCFAQFQADKSVVGLAKQSRTMDKNLALYEKNVNCTHGDFSDYYEKFQELQALERRNPRLKRLLKNVDGSADVGQAKTKRASQGEQLRMSLLREELEEHRCSACPDLTHHLRWAKRYQKLNKENLRLKKQIRGKTNTIANIFDRVCEVLLELGYLQKDQDISLTADGKRLQRIYGENDLLIAEALRSDVFKNLNPAALAAVVSTVVYEPKRNQPAIQKMPSDDISQVIRQLNRIWSHIDDIEQEYRLEQVIAPETGFVWPIFLWARGKDLEECIEDTELTGGDFVRWTKQVIDVLDQIANVDHDEMLTQYARTAISLIRRGVVSYNPEITDEDESDAEDKSEAEKQAGEGTEDE